MKKVILGMLASLALIMGGVPVANAANPGLIPSAAVVSTDVGQFAIQIYNYDPSFTWNIQPSVGTAITNNIGTVLVTGVGNASVTVVITTAKAGYDNGIKVLQASGVSPKVEITPQVDKYSQTSDGFVLRVSNYSSYYLWNAAVNLGSVKIDSSGMVFVTGLKKGQKATVSVVAFKPGYDGSVSKIEWQSQPPSSTISPALGQFSITNKVFNTYVSNYDDYYKWELFCSDGSASITNTGVISVANLTSTQLATCSISAFVGESFAGKTVFRAYSDLQALTLKPYFGPSEATRDGFRIPITNYNPTFSWNASVSGGTANVTNTGVLEISGLHSGATATVTLTTSIQGGIPVKVMVSGTTLPSAGIVPEFGEVLGTNDGFKVQLKNYNRFWDYGIETTDGEASIDTSGLISVRGLELGASAQITVFTSKGMSEGDQASVEGSALLTIVIPKPTKPSATKKPTTKPTKKPTTPSKGGVIVVGGTAKTIICVNGSSKRYVTSTNPICPPGYGKQ